MKIHLRTDELEDYNRPGFGRYTDRKEFYLTGYVEFTYYYHYDEDGKLTDRDNYVIIYSDNKTEIAAYSIKRIELLTVDDETIINCGKKEHFKF